MSEELSSVPGLLNKKQAAHYLGVKCSTLERFMRAGLPYIKLTTSTSGTVRFAISDLADFVASHRVTHIGNLESVPIASRREVA